MYLILLKLKAAEKVNDSFVKMTAWHYHCRMEYEGFYLNEMTIKNSKLAKLSETAEVFIIIPNKTKQVGSKPFLNFVSFACQTK
jgi:hypothetical protein